MADIDFRNIDGDRLRIDIDLTMMESTERRIIESHLRAIGAVVDGAKPQGDPDPAPVPEWRRLVDDQRSLVDRGFGRPYTPLQLAMFPMLRLAGGDPDDDLTEPLARIVAVCEREVGDGWIASLVDDIRSVGAPDRAVVGLLHQSVHRSEMDGRLWFDWARVAQMAASWLAVLTGDAS